MPSFQQPSQHPIDLKQTSLQDARALQFDRFGRGPHPHCSEPLLSHPFVNSCRFNWSKLFFLCLSSSRLKIRRPGMITSVFVTSHRTCSIVAISNHQKVRFHGIAGAGTTAGHQLGCHDHEIDCGFKLFGPICTVTTSSFAPGVHYTIYLDCAILFPSLRWQLRSITAMVACL